MWKVKESRIAYRSKLWKIRRDVLVTHTGVNSEYEYIDSPGGVIIVPILLDKNVIMIRQYRHTNNMYLYEFPAGVVKNSVFSSARRELQEETGYKSNNLSEIGTFLPYSGLSNEICHVFLAEELELAAFSPEATEEIEVLSVPYPKVEEYLLLTMDAKAITSWAITKQYLQKTREA